MNAQQIGSGQISGDFQSEVHFYVNDSITDAPSVNEKAMLNSYLNLNYINGPLKAGVRFETYQGPLVGYDTRYKGSGFPYRYLSYSNQFLEITAGTFYEQFGSGLILRTYEDRNLGYDNSLDGIRIKATPYKGISIKGIWGNQRFFWEKSKGIIRGADAEISLNDLSNKLNSLKTKIIAGVCFVSKFQKDIDPKYILPENVAAFSGRLNITRGKISIQSEYAYKYNDPSTENKFIYKPGHAFIINTTYARKGLGIIVAAKRTDNMSFRTDRTATGNILNINYLPALAREQTYSMASMYPLSTQANGEVGIQGQIFYAIKKGSALGGKYGTTITLAYDRTNDIKKEKLPESSFMGYESDFFDIGSEIFYEASTIELRRKISKSFSGIFSFVNIIYNQEVLLGHIGEQTIYSKVAIADLTWKLNDFNTIKYELQHLWTKQDKGNWAALQIEYSIAPKWFFNVGNQYNYGNNIKEKRIHYYNCGLGYVLGANRFTLSYGRQREGVICTGGICRNVPAYSGFGISIISSF